MTQNNKKFHILTASAYFYAKFKNDTEKRIVAFNSLRFDWEPYNVPSHP